MDASRAEFGDNQWLVSSMRDRFVADPTSIPLAWSQFFSSRPDMLQADLNDPTTEPPNPQRMAPDIVINNPAVKQSADMHTEPRLNPVPTVERREVRTDSPSTPGGSGGLSADLPQSRPVGTNQSRPVTERLAGARLRAAQNMSVSLSVPTATSVRSVPMKLAIEQRATINNFLRRTRGGKVSFTHLVAYAMVLAIGKVPAMNNCFVEVDGAPMLQHNQGIHLGLAIDIAAPDGGRSLLVPVLRDLQDLNFAEFWEVYEAIVRRAKAGQLQADDLVGATVSITNPGSLGTVASRPRLMQNQGTILGVGAIDYPASFSGTSAAHLAEMGISKSATLTSTYDHRIIQGAQSGEFLGIIHDLLLGADGFYDQIFESMRVPYPPLRWAKDIGTAHTDKDALVASLVASYRQLGHLQADTDPLEYRQRTHPDLELAEHGLTLWDLDRSFRVWKLGVDERQVMTLREIIDLLRDAYCHTIGIEYMHISDPEQRSWWQMRVERTHKPRPREEQLRILDQLIEAEVFETFLQTKYVGQTRFSLEGGESVIVLLAELCGQAADAALKEVCIGMPHRGRLNVLTNIVGKLYSQVFREFDHHAPAVMDVSGDVTYHLGADGNYTAASGKTISCSVAANPSHLEAVDPVLEGIARAKLDRAGDTTGEGVLPILMHGDASFASQGVVFETLQMSQLRPYRTGGTVHIVVNNQVGFTTAPVDARSSVYCTDVAKVVQAPVLHVNGDDPDACARVAELAFAYRQRFHKDVVIDLVCYRRRGHNESDDPSFTQPQMYDLIAQKRSVRTVFTQALIGRGDITTADAETSVARFRDRLEEVYQNVQDPDVPPEPDEYRIAPRYPDKSRTESAPPVTIETLQAIASVYENLPDGFSVHPKLAPQLQRRVSAILDGPVDWATAELMAFGSLLIEQHPVRLVGQDTRRGTFGQRFGAIVDRVSGEAWVPLKHLRVDQAPFDIYDSSLSEFAALGFEYGYSVASPNCLVCWEAQYGDFANGAQTIIDEFVMSGQSKWGQESGVVLLLPHGYEGGGPDHSSARIERFLASCLDDNITLAQPSSPASYFHLLRTHTLVSWHHPLVVMTPKSMLRNKLATSSRDDFVAGTWHPVLSDASIAEPEKVKRVLLCSGKLRWDLVAQRTDRGLDQTVAIIAIEQLFPLPAEGLKDALDGLPDGDIVWVQEEPLNQGPWPFLAANLPDAMTELTGLPFKLRGIGRPLSETPAVGSLTIHETQASELLELAFDALA